MQKPPVYPLGRSDRPGRWCDRLTADLELVVDPVERLEMSYCDSFDWRLYRTGRGLQCLRGRDGAQFGLVRLSDQRAEVTLPVDHDDRRFASDLPESALRTRLEALLEMRAFLPLAALKVVRHCLRREDNEGKTRARLYVEAFSLLDRGGRSRPLLKRLRLEPLRGYREDADDLRRQLERRYGLSRGEDDLFAVALARAGKRPGDYSSKLAIDLAPDMRADAALRRVLSALLGAMQANEAGLVADLDSEFLHDFRVAVRRTRSALGAFKRVFPPATLQRFRQEFAWLGSITGAVRDLDVYLLGFEAYKAAIPSTLREELELLRSFLQRKQRTEHEQLALLLRGRRYRKLKEQWQRYLASPLAKRPAARDAARPIGLAAHHRTWRMYKRVLKEGSVITPDSPSEALHELRKSCKKLRYLMEFFQSLYPPKGIRAAIRALKQLQDNLGEFQDTQVQTDALRRYYMEMRRRGEYTLATGEAVDGLLGVLASRHQRARAEFETRFAQFATEANHARFRRLFHPPTEAEAA